MWGVWGIGSPGQINTAGVLFGLGPLVLSWFFSLALTKAQDQSPKSNSQNLPININPPITINASAATRFTQTNGT
jgi:hypothetical protein